MPADIGVVGLGVMGSNIALNIADRGYRVVVYNRNQKRMQGFLDSLEETQAVSGSNDYADLCAGLHSPRVVLIMVTAGEVVDSVIQSLLPYMQPGDVIIDGGNSFYRDTERRYATLQEQGIRFVGLGVSGGEEGARHGPSLMPGGDPEAWPVVQDLLRAIAARAEDGQPCGS